MNDIQIYYDDTYCSRAARSGRETLSYSLYDAGTEEFLRSTVEEIASMGEIRSALNGEGFGYYLAQKLKTQNHFDLRTQEFIAPNGEISKNYIIKIPAQLQGTATRTFVFLAHYDIANYWLDCHDCPGANDNGSGIAALLALIKLFSERKIKLNYDVEFVFTGAEETVEYTLMPKNREVYDPEYIPPGLKISSGAEAYFNEARASGKDIIGFINIDTVGYNPCNDRIYIHSEPRSAWLVDLITRNNRNNLQISVDYRYRRLADQIRGWENNYMGIGIHQSARERPTLFHPGEDAYHTHADIPKRLNFMQMTKLVGVLAGVLKEIPARLSSAPFVPLFFTPEPVPNHVVIEETENKLVLEVQTDDNVIIRLFYLKRNEWSPDEWNFELRQDLLLKILLTAKRTHEKLREWRIISDEIADDLEGRDGAVNIFINHPEFRPGGGGFTPVTRSDSGIGPYISLGWDTDFYRLLEEVMGVMGNVDELISHEYVHLVQRAYRHDYLEKTGRGGSADLDFWVRPMWFDEGVAVLFQALLNPDNIADTGAENTLLNVMMNHYRFHENNGDATYAYSYVAPFYMIWKYGGGMDVFPFLFERMAQYPVVNSEETAEKYRRFSPFLDNQNLLEGALSESQSSYESFAEVIWGNAEAPGLIRNLFVRDFTIGEINFGDGFLPVYPENYPIDILSLGSSSKTRIGALDYKLFEVDPDIGHEQKLHLTVRSDEKNANAMIKVLIVGDDDRIIEEQNYSLSLEELKILFPQEWRNNRIFIAVGNMDTRSHEEIDVTLILSTPES